MTRYRDPRPEEIGDDHLEHLLPPDKVAYWRQMTDEDNDMPSIPRYVNTSSIRIDQDVRAYQNELLCAALRELAETTRLLREALEEAKADEGR